MALIYDALGGPLIDHVSKKDEPRDFADVDVRAAMREVSARETEERYAEELGVDGVNELLHFHNRVREVGPNAAREYADYVSARPRQPAVQEESDERDDYRAATQAALRVEKAKAQRQEQLPAAHAGLNQFKSAVGTLDPLADYLRWGKEIQQNPSAWPQAARDLAGRINEANGMQEAAHTLAAYEKQHRISADERSIMQRLLLNGEAHDLASAHQLAKHELSLNVRDEHARDVTRSVRQAEAPAMAAAKAEVDAFRRIVKPSPEIERRMKKLLESERASSLEEAFRMAKGVA